MTTITVGYYHSVIKGLKFKEQYQNYPYSIRLRNSIINYILKQGYNVMVQQLKSEPRTIIWIDDKNFKQKPVINKM